MPTQRYKLVVAYRGTRYHGWARQPWQPTYPGLRPPDDAGIPTVQETLSRALQAVLHHPVVLVGASRTDAGVHAKGQVAHFDTDQVQIPAEGLRQAVNRRLPQDILVRSLQPVPDTFNARSALSKRYQYLIWNAPDRPVFMSDLAWHRSAELDRQAMRQAAEFFVGPHDFASFAKPGHGRQSTIRTIHSCEVSWRGPRIVIGIEGQGFLWNMVRIMVGTLVEVGLGRYPPEAIREMLQARDRQAAGTTAPPHGLYLQWVRNVDVPAPPSG